MGGNDEMSNTKINKIIDESYIPLPMDALDSTLFYTIRDILEHQKNISSSLKMDPSSSEFKEESLHLVQKRIFGLNGKKARLNGIDETILNLLYAD